MSLRVSSWALVLCYLAAAVGANLLIAALGPDWLPLTAFVVIPFDLASRDLLHERWHGRHLWPRMLALVSCGALLTVVVNRQAHAVALASFIAFLASGLTDAAVYALAEHKSRKVRMNSSNVASAIVDSVAFPLVAFAGAMSPGLVVTQAVTKVVGGAIWSHYLLAWGLGSPEPGESRLAAAKRRRNDPSEEERAIARARAMAILAPRPFVPDDLGERRGPQGITPV